MNLNPYQKDIYDFLKTRKGKPTSPQSVARAVGEELVRTRNRIYRLCYREDVPIYRAENNMFVYSDEPVGTKATSQVRILEWWEQHKMEEVTPKQVSEALGDISRSDCSNHMSRLIKMLDCCHRLVDGVYIWDEENKHEYKSQADTVCDFIISKGGKASLTQMELELGICKPQLCRILKNLQRSVSRVKIKRESYIELLEDHRNEKRTHDETTTPCFTD